MKEKRNGFFLKDRLNDSQIEKFKLFENEELIFAVREHWLPLLIRLAKVAFFSLATSILIFGVIMILIQNALLAISFFLLAVLVGGVAVIREFIHWCFHIYIATNKQIIEVHYSPLLSHEVNSVLLDQIRCTEIDVEMHGIIPELIGIGNVELTFDRPTHKEEFIIKNIHSPRKFANLLSGHIHQNPLTNYQLNRLLWTREDENNRYRFLGDSNYGYATN